VFQSFRSEPSIRVIHRDKWKKLSKTFQIISETFQTIQIISKPFQIISETFPIISEESNFKNILVQKHFKLF